MRKNAVAFAVGALFAAPAAFGQMVFGNDTIGTVQFYGKLYPQVISGSSSGATQPGAGVSTLVSTTNVLTGTTAVENPGRRLTVDTQNSYLGFRGERKLGNTGLTGIWQIEQSVNFDSPGCAAGESCSGFSTRNSFLGLQGGFGTVKLGNMDTVYKEYGQVVSMFGLTSGNFISASNVLSQIGVGSSSTARFHERAANSIQYFTPDLGGFQAGLQYSPYESRNDVGDSLNKALFSAGIKYDNKQFYASLQYEQHKDRFGGSANLGAAGLRNGTGSGSTFVAATGAHSEDTAIRLSGRFNFGNHTLAGDVARLQWKESGQASGAKFVKYEHTTFAVGVESKWGGPWRTALQYVSGNEGSCTLTIGDCSTTGLTGKLYALGVAYDLDPQTFLYVFAARLDNGPSARYNNWASSNPARGGDVTQVALGLQYRF